MNAAAGERPLLRFPDQTAVALPLKQKDYQQAMLALVGDHPTLAEQLRTGQLDATYTRQVLEVYLHRKPVGFNPTALVSAAPPAKRK